MAADLDPMPSMASQGTPELKFRYFMTLDKVDTAVLKRGVKWKAAGRSTMIISVTLLSTALSFCDRMSGSDH